MCMCIYTRACVYIRTYIRACVYLCVYIRAGVYVCTYIHTHMHIYVFLSHLVMTWLKSPMPLSSGLMMLISVAHCSCCLGGRDRNRVRDEEADTKADW